jgi:hypothetical protein
LNGKIKNYKNLGETCLILLFLLLLILLLINFKKILLLLEKNHRFNMKDKIKIKIIIINKFEKNIITIKEKP